VHSGAASLNPRLHIAIVVPRFGEEIAGGAELLAWWLSMHLAASGHSIEVFTTCATNHQTWENVVPAGIARHDRILVRRFPTAPRDLGIYHELGRAIATGVRLSLDEELLWLRHGVSSTAMEDALGSLGPSFDLILALPYLFGITYFAFVTAPRRFTLIPCLHDEPYARCRFLAQMMAGSWGVMFNSPPEADLAQRLVPQLARWSVVGLGFDEAGPGDPEAFRRRYGLSSPLLLFAGRLETGKNVPELIEHFLRYQSRRQTDLTLVLAGSGDVQPPDSSNIVLVDIDWTERDGMYRAATIFCQPSLRESLSIVMMQAWLTGRPVLVDGRCAVTRYHCEESKGGLWFSGYAEFEQMVDRLLADPGLRDTLGGNGQRYVRRQYSWQNVLNRFHTSIAAWQKGDHSYAAMAGEQRPDLKP